MSYVDISLLKGVNDETLRFFPNSQVIGTAVLQFDTLTQFNAYIKKARIINEDGANPITYRTGQLSEPLKTVPINSQEEIDGWESFIQITPNAVTGQGILELDLVDRNEAMRK